MEIRETKDKSGSVFKVTPLDSDEFKEAERLFSAIAKKHSLISKGGICAKEAAKVHKGGTLITHKMNVPDSSKLRDQIVRSFEKEGHTVILEPT